MRRVRVCAGGSTFVSVGIERNFPSAERGSGRGARGHEGGERVRRREGVVLAKHPPTVGVPGHDPVAEVVGPEDGLALDEVAKRRIRIGEELRRERVESDHRSNPRRDVAPYSPLPGR